MPLSRKTIYLIILIGFSLYFFINDYASVIMMVLSPLLWIFYYKDKDGDIPIAKNSELIAIITISAIMVYFGYTAQLLSKQNPNQLIKTKQLIKEHYDIPQYYSVRSRVGSELILFNHNGYQVVVCSLIRMGGCQFYDHYNEKIYVEFIIPRKNFRQFILNQEPTGIVYYMDYKGQIFDNNYFIKKYNKELKEMYGLLIVLNLYLIFLWHIKRHYKISIRQSFNVVLKDYKSVGFLLFYGVSNTVYFVLFSLR